MWNNRNFAASWSVQFPSALFPTLHSSVAFIFTCYMYIPIGYLTACRKSFSRSGGRNTPSSRQLYRTRSETWRSQEANDHTDYNFPSISAQQIVGQLIRYTLVYLKPASWYCIIHPVSCVLFLSKCVMSCTRKTVFMDVKNRLQTYSSDGVSCLLHFRKWTSTRKRECPS